MVVTAVTALRGMVRVMEPIAALTVWSISRTKVLEVRDGSLSVLDSAGYSIKLGAVQKEPQGVSPALAKGGRSCGRSTV